MTDQKQKQQTHSSRPSASSPESELASSISKDVTQYTSCDFLRRIAAGLKLSRMVKDTACCYFHRFYESESPEEYNRFIVVQTCILLAAKAGDTPRRLSDITKFALSIAKDAKVNYEIRFAKKHISPEELRALVVEYELQLLHAVAWNVSVDMPHPVANKLVARVSCSDECRKKLVKTVFEFSSSILNTDTFLAQSVREVAAGCVLAAQEHCQLQVDNSALNLTPEEMEAARVTKRRILLFNNWSRRYGFKFQAPATPSKPIGFSTPASVKREATASASASRGHAHGGRGVASASASASASVPRSTGAARAGGGSCGGGGGGRSRVSSLAQYKKKRELASLQDATKKQKFGSGSGGN